MNTITTVCLLAVAQAQSFIETLTNQHSDELVHNLTFGTQDGNSAENYYQDVLYDAVLTDREELVGQHNTGLDFVLSDNGSKAPYDWSEKRYYGQNGPGTWLHESEKSGNVVTVIPAKQIETQTYTTECEEGASTECYKNKAYEKQWWNLEGCLHSDKDWCGYVNTTDDIDYQADGWAKKYAKSCGNDALIQGLDHENYDEEFVCRQVTPVWDADLDMTQLTIEINDDIDEHVRAQVYAEISKQISRTISAGVAWALEESLAEVIDVGGC